MQTKFDDSSIVETATFFFLTGRVRREVEEKRKKNKRVEKTNFFVLVLLQRTIETRFRYIRIIQIHFLLDDLVPSTSPSVKQNLQTNQWNHERITEYITIVYFIL